MLSQLCAYYDEYEEKLLKLYEKASPMAGVWGMGNHPKDAPCNEEFYENIETWTREFLAGNPSQQEAEAVAEWMLRLAEVHRQDKTFWFCFAIQVHAKGLIPLMSREKAHELKNWYDEAYPLRERLPTQRDIYKALEKKSGLHGDKNFGFFRKK